MNFALRSRKGKRKRGRSYKINGVKHGEMCGIEGIKQIFKPEPPPLSAVHKKGHYCNEAVSLTAAERRRERHQSHKKQ